MTTRENVNNEVLYDLYLRQNTIGVVTSNRMRRNGYVARIESKTYTAWCENLQQPLGTPTRIWQIILKCMSVLELDYVNWILLYLTRKNLWALANTVMNFLVPYNARNVMTS
jgi:hypothetical protein